MMLIIGDSMNGVCIREGGVKLERVTSRCGEHLLCISPSCCLLIYLDVGHQVE